MKIIIILTFFVYACTIQQINVNSSSNVYIEIKQNNYSGNVYFYIISDDMIRVYKEDIQKKRKQILKKRIDTYNDIEIQKFINNIDHWKYKYEEARLGGIEWEIKVKTGDLNKQIYCVNTLPRGIISFFKSINAMLPRKTVKLYFQLASEFHD
jgi:hypothetical protein